MASREIHIATILMIFCVIYLVNTIFQPRPIQISLSDDQIVALDDAEYFSYGDVILMVSAALITGMSLMYVLLRSDNADLDLENSSKTAQDVYKTMENILSGDEKKIYSLIVEAGGELLQKDLIVASGFHKVKMTRTLDSLQNKGLLVRIKYGMNNKVILKKNL